MELPKYPVVSCWGGRWQIFYLNEQNFLIDLLIYILIFNVIIIIRLILYCRINIPNTYIILCIIYHYTLYIQRDSYHPEYNLYSIVKLKSIIYAISNKYVYTYNGSSSLVSTNKRKVNWHFSRIWKTRLFFQLHRYSRLPIKHIHTSCKTNCHLTVGRFIIIKITFRYF